MIFRALISLAAATSVIACPQHDYNTRATDGLMKREDPPGSWTYAGSKTWGVLGVNDTLCRSGMTQSPINIPSDHSKTHVPEFHYSAPVTGLLFNWGFGPSYSLNRTNGADYSNNSYFKFDNETVYLLACHTHSPSEHRIKGIQARVELHLVHGDATGNPRGVIGIRINPSKKTSAFIAQFISEAPGSASSLNYQVDNFDMSLALEEVGGFETFWTYMGSLTTPSCTEGMRWWLPGDILEVSDAQMQALLSVSVYSAREEQMVWNHIIGI